MMTRFAALIAITSITLAGCAELDERPTFREAPLDNHLFVTTSGPVESMFSLEDDNGQHRGFAVYTNGPDGRLRHEVVSLTENVAVEDLKFSIDDAQVDIRPGLLKQDGAPQANTSEHGWVFNIASGGTAGFGFQFAWTPSGSDTSTFRLTINTPGSEHSWSHSLVNDANNGLSAAETWMSVSSMSAEARSWWNTGNPFGMRYALAYHQYQVIQKQCGSSGGGGSGGGSGSSGTTTCP